MEKERKFDMHVCRCGRLHFVKNEDINLALNANKELLLVCGRCGEATAIGANRTYEDENKECFMMYSHSAQESFVIDAESFLNTKAKKGYSKVIYDMGVPVPMMTGYNANSHCGDFFYDTTAPEWWKIQRRGITVEEIQKFISDFQKASMTVNMPLLLRNLTEEQAECASCYAISAFDWSGTPYQKF